jgi:hypothetical protein
MIKKISLLSLGIIAAGCSFFVRPKVTFEIENNTSKDLNMKVFSKSRLLNDISIKALSKYDTTITYGDPGDNGQQTPFAYEIVDSIVVIMGNSKVIKYYCDGEVLSRIKNPLDFEYSKTSQVKSTTTKRLVYDESDFSKAEPL